MSLKFLYTLLIFEGLFIISPQKISQDPHHRLIVWDVGQGQWITYQKHNLCFHFDTGGEYFFIKKIRNACSGHKNFFYFTHADRDHINFLPKIIKKIQPSYLVNPPKKALKKWKLPKKYLRIIASHPEVVKTLYNPKSNPSLSSNQNSKVYLVNKTILISGDSEKKNEKIWSQHPLLSSVNFYILGHHGSNTSTSQELLDRLPNLKIAIASARKSRYGHPHGLVKIRLYKNKTPVLSTNNWGHIIFEL